MVYYRAVGSIPRDRHVLYSLPDGSPTFEEFIGEEGFASTGSLLYHRHVPSNLVDAYPWHPGDDAVTANVPLLPHHFRLPDLGHAAGQDLTRHRRLVLANPDVRISYVVGTEPSPLCSNAIGDEIVFVEAGAARLESVFGTVDIRQGDNVVVPRATIHRWVPDVTAGPLRALCIEASGHVHPPAKHRSRFGQFLEGAPINERDIRGPIDPLVVPGGDAAGSDTEVYVKHRGADGGVVGTVMVYDHHPFDVVGWDGYLYPYAFNYRDIVPLVGKRIHPPPTNQVFEGPGFVVCNFVPRPLEFGEGSIKVPYYHSNADSDEVMFYFAGETAARKGSGIITGSVSLHPAGYTHGPRRAAYLDSPNHTEATEMAFMVDTFRPLQIGEAGRASAEPSYPWTWSGRGPGIADE